MVVVVQALAAGEPGEHAQVGGRVVGEVSPAPPVAEAVDRRGQHEEVEHEVGHGQEQPPGGAQDQHGRRDADHPAERALVEEHAVPHVDPDVLGPAGEGLGVAGLANVVIDVPELDLPEAVTSGLWGSRSVSVKA